MNVLPRPFSPRSPTHTWPVLTFPFACQPKEISDASFLTEIRAGLTTFATMAYIIAVNVSCVALLCFYSPCHLYLWSILITLLQASVLSATGGPCICSTEFENNVCVDDDAYRQCVMGMVFENCGLWVHKLIE